MHLDMELESGKGTVESQSGDKNSNIDRLRKSLMCLNVAAGVSRSDELVPTVLMYELDKNGKNSYKNMTLRDLLQYVLLDVNNELEVSTPARLDSAVGDLKLRDLRRLDFLFNPNEECAVLIRKHVVLVSLVRILLELCSSKLAR